MTLPALPRRFHTITLGCKLNRFDSAAIEAELEGRGLRPAPSLSEADVVVVNTCTVTARADAEARRLLRRVRRENASCRLLVTGCYAELEPGTLAAVERVDGLFGNRDKARLPEILDRIGVPAREPASAPAGRGSDAPAGLRFGERGRAYLKVQEGCDLGCSYCVIPRARGRSRSVPADRVAEGLRGLIRAGYREVVLTGVNTGAWGRDLSPRGRLEELLRLLLDGLGPNRIRLNSLEPLTLTDGIVRLLAEDPRLAPHVQVPLQSGSDRILEAMGRNYRASAYLERVEKLRAAVPDAAIGADVIVGFPGETDDRFEETCRFLEASPLDYLHVFAWSPRAGTPAERMPGRPRAGETKARSERLRRFGEARSLRFRERFVGRTLDALALGDEPARGRARALTGNFIETTIEGARPAARQPLLVRIGRIEGNTTFGSAVGVPGWAQLPDALPVAGGPPAR